MTKNPLASMPFPAAAAFWFEQHSRYIKANTAKNYSCALKVFREFFGETLLCDITIADIRRYQDERGQRAGNYLLNSEVSILQMILKEARLWEQIKDLYQPLPVPKRRAGHSISQDEERILREVAFSRSKWRLAAHCMMVMLSTSMGFGELRHVRRRDVDLKRKSVMVVDGAKNDYRDRLIPLTATAFESMAWIIERWEDLGGKRDDEFILPHRPRSRGGPWILTEPMTAITSAFNKIRKEAGLPKFRVYDCRVQAITKLLSNPAVSPQVSKEIAGHISQAMQNRYSIQQFNTKKAALDAALDALEGPTVPPPVKPGPLAPAPALDVLNSTIQAEIARRLSLPAVPPPADVYAELARLTQMVEQLQAQAQQPARARRRATPNQPPPGQVVGRRLAGSPRPALIQFPHKPA